MCIRDSYYNVFGTNDRIPKDSVTVTVTGPGGVSQVACYVGEAGSRTTCPGTAGTTARFEIGAAVSYTHLDVYKRQCSDSARSTR